MTNPNDSAHPQIETDVAYDGEYNGNTFSTGGLTKREHFAAMAMQGLIGKLDYYEDDAFHGIAKDATSLADNLIDALNKSEVK